MPTLAQVFSREYCEIFKNSFFYRTPPVAAGLYFSSEKKENSEKNNLYRIDI